MSDEMLSYLRIGAIFVSTFYGLWQYFQKRRLENFIANKAIALSATISIALGASQNAKNAIVNDLTAMSEIGRTEGLLNVALIDSADLFCSLKKTTIDDIEELSITNNTIQNYQQIFNKFSDRRIGFIRKVFKSVSKVY